MVKKRNASGWAWYVYAWRGGPQVYRSEGSKKPSLPPNVLHAVADAVEKRNPPPENNLRLLIRQWRSLDAERPSSPEWERLAPNTKKTWGSALDLIERKWGEVPLEVFNNPRMKPMVVKWRDSRSSTPRAADMGLTVLHALLKFGVLHGKVTLNVAADIPKLYRDGTRAEIIWTDEEVSAFCDHADRTGRSVVADALRLAVTTGFRREDLITVTWSHVSEVAILMKAKKRSRGQRFLAKAIRIPELNSVLVKLETRPRQPGVETLLVDEKGRSWTADRLTKAVGAIRDELGLVHVDPETGETKKKHLHDARGTYATKLIATRQLTNVQIAEAMGWSPQQVAKIKSMYVDPTVTIVALGERVNR